LFIFIAGDVLVTGLVKNLAHPEGNSTGVTNLFQSLAGKWVGLLKEAVPRLQHVGGQTAARRLGLEIIVLKASNENEIEAAFANAAEQRADALFFADIYFESRRDQIAALGLRHALPVMMGSRDGVVAGGLMSYGPDTLDFYREAGVYVGRILKGDKPSGLPVVQATKLELVINMKTASALGLTILPNLLALADEVIE
jgi:putative tryptophan/tyrosine transport system substrate-binding protein